MVLAIFTLHTSHTDLFMPKHAVFGYSAASFSDIFNLIPEFELNMRQKMFP